MVQGRVGNFQLVHLSILHTITWLSMSLIIMMHFPYPTSICSVLLIVLLVFHKELFKTTISTPLIKTNRTTNQRGAFLKALKAEKKVKPTFDGTKMQAITKEEVANLSILHSCAFSIAGTIFISFYPLASFDPRIIFAAASILPNIGAYYLASYKTGKGKKEKAKKKKD